MSKFNTDVVYKITKEKKGTSLELGNLYFKNVPVTYAQVHKPAKKWQSEDTAYQMNVFINKDTMGKVEDLGVNKEFAEVGVTKKKKGANRGQFKFPQEGANENYGGMFAVQLSRNTVKRDKQGDVVKEYEPLKVIDSEGNAFTQDVGNGSVCTVKLFTYRNAEDMLVLMMDTVMVVDHVPYEGGDGSGGYDDEMGVTIPAQAPVVKASSTVDEPTPIETVTSQTGQGDSPDSNEDDLIPF